MNGINLNKTIHNGYDAAHQVYNGNLFNYLEKSKGFINSPSQAKEFLISLQARVRSQLENGKKLNEIIFEP